MQFLVKVYIWRSLAGCLLGLLGLQLCKHVHIHAALAGGATLAFLDFLGEGLLHLFEQRNEDLEELFRFLIHVIVFVNAVEDAHVLVLLAKFPSVLFELCHLLLGIVEDCLELADEVVILALAVLFNFV